MPYLVLDLEMSGPDPEFDEIIQIGAQIFSDSWEPLGEFLQNVCPEDEDNLTAAAEAVHGLSKYDLRDAPMLFDALEALENFVYASLRRKRPAPLKDIVLCGQSVYYDLNFLKLGYNRQNMDWPFSNKLMDLHTIAYFMERILKANQKGTPKSLSLGAIASYFGVEREDDTHNALEDAKMTAYCMKAYFQLAERLKFTT